MAALYMEYRRSSQFGQISFEKYLVSIGFVDPATTNLGMDDAAQLVPAPGGPELITIPTQAVSGKVRVKVLLVDFPDRPGFLEPSHYEDLLFSQGIYPTGSMRDYYKEVSFGKVDIEGTVHGWLHMQQPYSYYTNNESGTQWNSYPHNAPRLAEDAVKAAIAAGVPFEPELDKFGQGIITALFIVHAGRGAEVMPTLEQQKAEIWSHKWQLSEPIQVAPNLAATIYLTVPHNCKVGVCAHELGHLAFQWQDFYDPNYAVDGQWDGSGVWDLMAGGSYNGNSARPAHPAALHKLQHGWITASTVTANSDLTIKPYTGASGQIYKIVSPKYQQKQYLLLENRKKFGFDFDLPGEGLLVWKVDEAREQTAPDAPGMSLVQADGRADLSNPNDWNNQGDAADPFPGIEEHDALGDTGVASTSFPGARSGVSLTDIKFSPEGVVTLKVKFANVAVGGGPQGASARPIRSGPARSGPVRAGSRNAPARKRAKKQPHRKTKR
jgi:immune inhibitor A